METKKHSNSLTDTLLTLDNLAPDDNCSESDQELEERELIKLKKEIKHKIKRRKGNKKVHVGSGFTFDITDYFRFKKRKDNSTNQSILNEIGGSTGYMSWMLLLFAVINASLIPSWCYSIRVTKFVGFGWIFFIESFLLIPFAMHEYRTADQNTKHKYQLSYILRTSNLKKIFFNSLSVFFWFFCVGTLSEWTQISHVLALAGLVNFFLSINRRIRNSGHDLQPGGQVLIVVGILLIFQDSYSLSNVEGASQTVYHGYLNRNASQRMLADLGALLSSLAIAKFSEMNVDVKDSYPPYLSMMLTSLFVTLNLILAAYFFNGATFNFEEEWGVFNLFIDEKQGSLFSVGIVLIFGLILSYTLISKTYPNPLIPALAMSFEPILSSLILQLSGIQFIPGSFGCLGYIFMLLGNFLILIGQWMFQRIHKKEEIQQKALLSELIGESVRKEFKVKEKKQSFEMGPVRKNLANSEMLKKEIKNKLKKKVSLDVSYEDINKAIDQKDYRNLEGELDEIQQIH